MQLRIQPLFLGTILLAGCYSHPDPAPRPHTVVSAGKPIVVKRDSTRSGGTITTTTSTTLTRVDVSAVDVAQRAADVFGDSLAIAKTISSDAPDEPTWDMDVRSYETQARVAHYVSMFTGRSKDRIAERLERGTRYEPMIRAKLKAGGLPEDMYYLALVESGFDPHAYSRAAAVGMWQFMTSTARDMGMRVDWWVDERRDPVRSTTAAVRFLRGLRNQFGSLYLAAAAYNGGPGRVSRGLARFADDLVGTAGDDAFFVLAENKHFKNETAEYVPQLIAAALIAKEPTRYGMELRPMAPLAYDSVRVPASTPLAAVAKASGSPLRDVIELNSHLLRGMTPPRESYLVRVPVGASAGFDSAFAALPSDVKAATVTVETKKGDTAERIGRELGVSGSAVAAFNPSMRRLKSGRLAPGQRLVVPTPAVVAAALDIPDPAIERYPSSTARLKVHTVRRGESLRAIARRYSLSPERLMRINGLRKPVIFPGQTLLLSGSSSKARSAATRSASRTKASAKATTASRAKSTAKAKRPSKAKTASKSASSKKAKTTATGKSSGAGSKAGARTKR
jgi:membrane-bound lytic murein transglycosylase D